MEDEFWEERMGEGVGKERGTVEKERGGGGEGKRGGE